MKSRRELTEEDWKALYSVWELFHQVSLHGKRALLPFAQGVIAVSLPPEPQP